MDQHLIVRKIGGIMMIPYGKQDITQQDNIDAVVEVLRSTFLSWGPKVPLFERTVASKVGAKHALGGNDRCHQCLAYCVYGTGSWSG